MSSVPLDGLLLIDKPSGPTSHDVIGQVRRALGQKRVGHSGTLDPMASGLLPLMLGRATRLVRFLPHTPKSYRGTFVLGMTTDTDDVTGKVLSHHDGPLPTEDAVSSAAAGLVGHSLQVPPAYSARKVAGRRLYALAREGTAVEAPPAPVEVFAFRVVPTTDATRFEFVADVSRGTYIRAMVRDIGRELGCGGALASLVRTSIGPLRLADAAPPPTEGAPESARIRARVVPTEQIPLEASTVQLEDDGQVQRFVQGAALELSIPPGAEAPLRVLDPLGGLLGMAESRDGLLRPRVVLR